MIAVIDNYDSFTYNLVQYLGTLGASVEVYRNDAVRVEALAARPLEGLVISPGPGEPRDAGISEEAIRTLAGRIPILGVCLGHQALAEVYGGRVVRASRLMHGKTSLVHHDGTGCFAGLPSPLEATRYHSLVVDPWGEILADGGEAPGVVYADLNLGRADAVRAMLPSLAHDRPFAPPQESAGDHRRIPERDKAE